MAGHGPPKTLAISGTVYGLLLCACPARYRREYGPLMLQAFRDLAREAYRQHGSWGILLLWLRVLPDTCSTALGEHIIALKERRAVANVALAAAGAQGGYSMRSRLTSDVGYIASMGALLAGAFSVWPVYMQGGLWLIMRLLGPGSLNNPLSQALTIPVSMWSFWVTTLLSELGFYLGVSAVGIILALAALLFGPRKRVLLAVEALTLVGMLAFPWLFHYQAAVVAAPGEVVYVATQPDLLDGVVKAAQGSSEIVPSTYEILGWSGDGVLYYREIVATTQTTRTWAYTPGATEGAQLVTAAEDLVPTAPAEQEALLERVRAQVWPESAEPSTRALHIREDGLASPDGRWAAVVTKHIYGPQDVIVVGMQ